LNVKMLSGSFADAETVIEALEYEVKPEIILAVVLGHGAVLMTHNILPWPRTSEPLYSLLTKKSSRRQTGSPSDPDAILDHGKSRGSIF